MKSSQCTSQHTKPRVLVVEDQWLIAGMIEAELRDLGFEVIGPAHSLSEAQSLMNQNRFAAAVMNFNLNSDTTAELARMLRQRGCPVLFVSARGPKGVTNEFSDCTWLQKPFSHEELSLAIQQVTAASTQPKPGDCPCLS
jgi:DNA-binding response OmpR family regulator